MIVNLSTEPRDGNGLNMLLIIGGTRGIVDAILSFWIWYKLTRNFAFLPFSNMGC